MKAIIRTGGKQYMVSEGEILDIELVETGEKDSKATLSEVLMTVDGSNINLGKPLLSGASVTVELVEEIKAKKVTAFKYRRREGYHRTVGHRQKLSRVKVTKITV